MVLDALDECSQRSEVMEILARMGRWQLQHSHVIVTSRRERDIESVMQRISSRRTHICLGSEVIDEDIRQYVRQRLSDDEALNKWGKDAALRQEIEAALTQGSQGMFRWAVCQLDALGKCRNRAALRKSLATLPPTLEKTYDRVLCGITEEDSVYAIRVLRWLTFAERALTLDEIAEIVAIDVEREAHYDEEEVFEDPMEVLDICSSLVSMSTHTDDRKQGSSRQFAMLAHYSVKEYFLSDRIRTGSASQYSMQHTTCHSILARSCLGYLEQILQSDLRSNETLQKATLARYCAEFWMNHAEEAGEGDAETAQVVVRLLSAENTAYLNWLQIYDPDDPWGRPNLTRSLGNVAHPLYYAALFGLANVVDLLLEKGADANAQGGQYGNALQAAAGSGHERTVQLLIAHGAQIDALNPRYGSALQAASEGGHHQVVKHLIHAGADVNLQGGDYGSALDLAIGNEHSAVVQLLLENGADVELISQDGQSPLDSASTKGHVGIVKLLLEYGADVSATNDEGWTPVNSASDYGHLEVAKLLIESGADVRVASSRGWTPLHSASDSGHLDVVRLLLDEEAGAPIPSQDGWTPLIAAATNGHYDIVRLLLNYDKDKIALNSRSTKGCSALFCAAANGHTDVVRLLLIEGAKIELEDVYGETPLIRAAISGHTNVLTLLFAMPEIGPNYRDRYGRTVVYFTAAHGNAEAVKTLIHEYQCDPSIADSCNRSPLSIAAKRGHRAVVEALQLEANVVVSDEDFKAARKLERTSNLTCDICRTRIAPSDFHYHCHICGNGDWDNCAECKDLGMTCLDDTHTLVKRTMGIAEKAWIEVA